MVLDIELSVSAWFQKTRRVLLRARSLLLPVSYTHLRAHETDSYLVCRLLLEKKNEKYAPHPKQTSKSTAARRPRPTRDGVRQNTSQAVAHTRALPPSIPRLWKSASLVHIRTRTAAAAPFVFVLVHDVLASAASAFSIVIPGICLWFRSCPVVLDIELSVSAWYQKTRRVLLSARCLLLLLLLHAAASGGVRHKTQNYMRWSETKKRFWANRNTRK